MNKDIVVGGTGLSPEVTEMLSDFIAQLDTICQFNHGSTAAFYHVATILTQHIKDNDD